MIKHHEWFKLQEFRSFWESELKKDRNKRFIPIEYRRDIFEIHSKNMKRIGERIMAKPKTLPKKFEWKGYVNVDVPEAKVPDLERYVADDKNVFYEYNQMLVTHYQVKQFHDSYSESIKTTAICYLDTSPNFGYALSAYAEDWYTSLAVLIFKHLVLCDGTWVDYSVTKIRKFG